MDSDIFDDGARYINPPSRLLVPRKRDPELTTANYDKIGLRAALRHSLDATPSPVSPTPGETQHAEEAAVAVTGSPNRGPGRWLDVPATADGAGGVGGGGGESRN
jgi:hypothetical protein